MKSNTYRRFYLGAGRRFLIVATALAESFANIYSCVGAYNGQEKQRLDATS
jgi:hypothetical protein